MTRMFPTATKPEPMSEQVAAGRNAGLHNPHSACPYETPEERDAWYKGLKQGIKEADDRTPNLSGRRLGPCPGRNAGFYAPNAYCPYSGALSSTWYRGFLAGHDAAIKLKTQFGRRHIERRTARQPKPVIRRTPSMPAVIGEGRLASDVTNPQEIKRIWKAYKKNGGKLTYQAIEKEFGLKQTNGMSAYRVVHKFAEA